MPTLNFHIWTFPSENPPGALRKQHLTLRPSKVQEPSMPTKEQVLDNWYKRVSATQNANYQSAHHFALCSRWFGVPVISLSGFVGSSVFTNLEKQPDIRYQIFVGFCSIAAAVLASLQTYFGYAERAKSTVLPEQNTELWGGNWRSYGRLRPKIQKKLSMIYSKGWKLWHWSRPTAHKKSTTAQKSRSAFPKDGACFHDFGGR